MDLEPPRLASHQSTSPSKTSQGGRTSLGLISSRREMGLQEEMCENSPLQQSRDQREPVLYYNQQVLDLQILSSQVIVQGVPKEKIRESSPLIVKTTKIPITKVFNYNA